MARVVAFVPDLLFGSNVLGALRAAGHQAILTSDLETVDPRTVDVLIVDLTADVQERIQAASATELESVPKLAFYAHVEADVRALAQQSGFDLVVPRSRMAREGSDLVGRLSQLHG